MAASFLVTRNEADSRRARKTRESSELASRLECCVESIGALHFAREECCHIHTCRMRTDDAVKLEWLMPAIWPANLLLSP